MQADVLLHQDVFMMYDELEATKTSGDNMEEFKPILNKNLSDEMFDQDVDDFKEELNQELEALNNDK